MNATISEQMAMANEVPTDGSAPALPDAGTPVVNSKTDEVVYTFTPAEDVNSVASVDNNA